MELFETIKQLCQGARRASYSIALASESERNELLKKIAEDIKTSCDGIIEANAIDLKNAKENGISDAMLEAMLLFK